MEVCILSNYLGARWAARIIKDWGCTVSNHITPTTDIVITDELIPATATTASQKPVRIILTDVQKSSPHCLALSGVLSTFGQKEQLFVPNFVVEAVVSNSLAILCLQYLHIAKNSTEPKAEEHRVSIIELLTYFGGFFINAKANNMGDHPRGKNFLEGGAPFYSVYKCKEGFLAVGSYESKFYEEMIKGLNLTEQEKQYWIQNQWSMHLWDKMREMLGAQFIQRTSFEWQQYFKAYDTCITEIKAPFKSDKVQPKLSPLRPKL